MSGPVQGSVVTRWRTGLAEADGGRDGLLRWLAQGRLGGRAAAADLASAAGVTCLALPQLIHHARYVDPQLGLYLMLSVLLIVPLTARSRFPLSVLVLVAGAMLAQAWVGIALIAGASLLICAYSVASRYPMRFTAPSGLIAVAEAVPVGLHASDGFGFAEVVVIASALVLAAIICGGYVQGRAVTIRALTDAAAQVARERDQHAHLAVARERAQIAREMHDIVAHSLSVMVTLAEAAALKVPAHPDEAAATMGRVSEVGRHALDDSRSILVCFAAIPARAEVAAPGTQPRGHGIQGMRERAGAHGGTLTAGCAPQGGFDVRAELPLTVGVRLGDDQP